MKNTPLTSKLPSFLEVPLSSDLKKISKYLDLIFEGRREKIRFDDVASIAYRQFSYNNTNEIIQKVQEKFNNNFKDYLNSSLSPYDKESSNVDELAKDYILKTGDIMPHFEKVVKDISSIFKHVSIFRGNFNFYNKFHLEFIRMLEECDCYDYIFFSISKLLDVFLDQYQLDTFFEEPLFQSVHHTKDLISYASPEKLQVLKELLFEQTQAFFINFVTDSYQQLIPPLQLSANSDEENQESNTSLFSGISHKIADGKEAFDPIPHIVFYCDEAFRLVELEFQMTCTLFDKNLANDVKNEALRIISDPEMETMQFCLSQTHLFCQNRKYDEFVKLFNISKQQIECVEILTKNICEQIPKEPKTIDKLPEVIEFYTKIAQNLFSTKREYNKFSENIHKCLVKLANSDSEGVLKGLLKIINTAALTDSDIKPILPIISLFQMRSEFELMHLRHVARRLTLNRIEQIDNETEILEQLETVRPPLQLDSLRVLINDAARSLQNSQYGQVLLLNATSWPYKPPYPSPIGLSEITVKINNEYIKNNPNRELQFPINYWIVKVKDTISGTIYDGTGVQAEVFLYFNNHKVITSTALEPRISESFLGAALKAMSSKDAPALVSNDGVYSINNNWMHDRIVKLKHPNYKDEVQVAKNAEKSKGDMIEACAVKRMKAARILKFSELDEYIKSELASKVPVSTDEVRKHIDLLINRGYLEEMGSGRLAYIS